MCFYSRQTKKAVELINRYNAGIVNIFKCGYKIAELQLVNIFNLHKTLRDLHRSVAG